MIDLAREPSSAPIVEQFREELHRLRRDHVAQRP
jgi:hypothetical protein